ncbi:MAG TPA: hypothetical protein VHQ86_05960, partial [Candidatus Saccharimonadia bacterium]|nr:hypothetical protein [Candidatus Saccharimonadia bacterium]
MDVNDGITMLLFPGLALVMVPAATVDHVPPAPRPDVSESTISSVVDAFAEYVTATACEPVALAVATQICSCQP